MASLAKYCPPPQIDAPGYVHVVYMCVILHSVSAVATIAIRLTSLQNLPVMLAVVSVVRTAQ